jgi:hypothetical protein
MPDHTRLRDIGNHIGGAADCVLIPKDGRQPFDAVDAVLQRDDARVGANERPSCLACGFGIP